MSDAPQCSVERIEAFLAEEGFVPKSVEEVFASAPHDILMFNWAEYHPGILAGTYLPSKEEQQRISDARAPHFDLLMMGKYEPRVRTLLQVTQHILACPQKDVIVDAGCGTGLTACFLAELLPHAMVHAYDFSPEMLARTQQRVARRNLAERVHCFLADHELIYEHLAPASVDVLLTECSMCDIPFYAPSPEDGDEELWNSFVRENPLMQQWRAMLAAFAEVLKPGGIYFDYALSCWRSDALLDAVGASVGLPAICGRTIDEGIPSYPGGDLQPFAGMLVFQKSGNSM